jgi:hypothetical protein
LGGSYFLIKLPTIIGIATFISFKIYIPYPKKMKEKLRAKLGYLKLKKRI